MSQENVDRAREAYGALGLAIRTGDLDPFFREYVHPEIEWAPLGRRARRRDFAWPRPRQGSHGGDARCHGGAPDRSWEIIDAGDRVVVAIRMSGRGRGSGIDVEANWFHVLTARDDKAVRIAWYASRAEALEAAGLSE